MKTIQTIKLAFLLLLLTSFLGCGSSDTSEETNEATQTTRLLIPFYVYPDNYYWDRLVAVKAEHPTWDITAIVNQSNGDFTTLDANYKSGIVKLHAAGIRVIGYVYTQYGARSSDAIKANIDSWVALYKSDGLSGMFFDEGATTYEKIGYYKDLTDYAKTKGLLFSVLNPGVTTHQDYIDQNVSSVIVVVEDAYAQLTNKTITNRENSATKLAILMHTTPTKENEESVVAFAKENDLEYIYVTDDTLVSNPWDTLSSYY